MDSLSELLIGKLKVIINWNHTFSLLPKTFSVVEF